MSHQHVRIAVTDAKKRGFENVPATLRDDGSWVLMRSPLYATQVAAGDVVRQVNPDDGSFEILLRGGNVSVQFYLADQDADDAQRTKEVAQEILSNLATLNGRLDGATPGLCVFTIPVSVGFSSIEKVFEAAELRFPGSQWQFGNVHDPDSGEPLNWWRPS